VITELQASLASSSFYLFHEGLELTNIDHVFVSVDEYMNGNQLGSVKGVSHATSTHAAPFFQAYFKYWWLMPLFFIFYFGYR
jgi:hypothetical protein